jgi:hypothetical protein
MKFFFYTNVPETQNRYYLPARRATGIRFGNQSGGCPKIRMDRASSGG